MYSDYLTVRDLIKELLEHDLDAIVYVSGSAENGNASVCGRVTLADVYDDDKQFTNPVVFINTDEEV